MLVGELRQWWHATVKKRNLPNRARKCGVTNENRTETFEVLATVDIQLHVPEEMATADGGEEPRRAGQVEERFIGLGDLVTYKSVYVLVQHWHPGQRTNAWKGGERA